MSNLEDDPVLRAVAAAPPLPPPAPMASVLLVRPGAGNTADQLVRLRGLIEPHLGRVTVLANGAYLVALPETGGAAAQAAQAAECALSLHETLPGARVAVAMGRADPAGPSPSRAALERAAALLAAAAKGSAIDIDDVTAGLLETGFEIAADGSRRTLIGRSAPRAAAAGAAAPSGVDTSALELVLWGLRFERPGTEAAYRNHHLEDSIPFTRVGMAASFVVWGVYLVAARYVEPESFPRIAAFSLLLTMPLTVLCLGITYRPALHRWLFSAIAATNATAGLVAVWLCSRVGHRQDLAMGTTMIATYFGLVIFRMRIAQAAASTLPDVLFHQWLLIDAVKGGSVDGETALLYSVTAWVVFATGLPVSAVIERTSRQAYRQEQIIDAQRQAIARERARSEQLQTEAREREVKLLNAELRRQVAERSRDLVESLSRFTSAPRPPARLAPGDIIEDRYRVIRPLGEGGMGQVHEVERVTDGKRLALKVMTGVAHREALARFAREAQIAAQFDHPNVVAALDVGVTVDGALYLVMQLVQGSTLARERARYGDARWAAPILLQIAQALAAMHRHGIVHRDLKPSNVLLDGSMVKVADFGIASLAGPVGEATLTRSGALIGTPLYMAPELAAGVREATPAADVFSLGVIAYELFANRFPFATPPVLERAAGRDAAAPPPLAEIAPHLPAELASLVEQCLASAPAARPTAAAAVETLALQVAA